MMMGRFELTSGSSNGQATGANGLDQVLGNLEIAKGNYAQAEQYFKDSNNNSAALANILNKNYAQASVALKYAKEDAMTNYLQAILNARQGKNAEAEGSETRLCPEGLCQQRPGAPERQQINRTLGDGCKVMGADDRRSFPEPSSPPIIFRPSLTN